MYSAFFNNFPAAFAGFHSKDYCERNSHMKKVECVLGGLFYFVQFLNVDCYGRWIICFFWQPLSNDNVHVNVVVEAWQLITVF